MRAPSDARHESAGASVDRHAKSRSAISVLNSSCVARDQHQFGTRGQCVALLSTEQNWLAARIKRDDDCGNADGHDSRRAVRHGRSDGNQN
jgi:hypothetical protein